jgi:hypothetical protein
VIRLIFLIEKIIKYGAIDIFERILIKNIGLLIGNIYGEI